MKRIGILLTALLAFSVANANAGVSVSVGQPGFYGQIEIGDVYPAPRVIYSRPVVIEAQPVYATAEPIYLHVPPGHAKHWSKFCGRYEACGRPVYFVNDTWYNQTYAPRYREYHEHGDRHDGYEDHDRGDGDDHGHGDHGDHGNGHGHGHDK